MYGRSKQDKKKNVSIQKGDEKKEGAIGVGDESPGEIMRGAIGSTHGSLEDGAIRDPQAPMQHFPIQLAAKDGDEVNSSNYPDYNNGSKHPQDRGNPFLGWIPWTLHLSYDRMLRGIPGTGTREKGMSGKLLNVNLDAIILFRFHGK